jgi:hypothetical protein
LNYKKCYGHEPIDIFIWLDFLALFICPEAFLVGIIGSMVLFTKRRKTVQK